jgi:hypothetical protein
LLALGSPIWCEPIPHERHGVWNWSCMFLPNRPRAERFALVANGGQIELDGKLAGLELAADDQLNRRTVWKLSRYARSGGYQKRISITSAGGIRAGFGLVGRGAGFRRGPCPYTVW